MDFLQNFQAIGSNIWIYGGAFLLVLSILVFVHEWGHYIVARLCGVRVEVFSIGFGPELFGIRDSHGTRWKFSLIPLGGYVKMYGDSDPASATHEDVASIPEAQRSEAFFTKPVGKRAAIVFAGPAINYIYAIIIMALVFAFNGQVKTPPYVGAVMGDTAAQAAGLMPHDEIVSIQGKPIKSFEDIRRFMLVGMSETMDFEVLRDGQTQHLQVTPEVKTDEDRFGFKSSRGFLGITSAQHAVPLENIVSIDGEAVEDPAAVLSARFGQRFVLGVDVGGDAPETFEVKPLLSENQNMAQEGYVVLANGNYEVKIHYSPVQAVGQAFSETWEVSVGSLQALWQMVAGTRSATELGGLIRIGALAGDVAQKGFLALVTFSALLSINLGLINLFPIPVLDGGHLLFYGIEAAIGKPVPERAQEIAFRFGFGFLIVVMAFANINDLVQIFM